MGHQTSKIKHAKVILLKSFLLTVYFSVLSINIVRAAPCAVDATSSACTAESFDSVSVHALVIDPNAATSTPPVSGGGGNSGGGGGFGGGDITTMGGKLTFSGQFSPNSSISLLLSGSLYKTVYTNQAGYYVISIDGLAQGLYSVVLSASDITEKKSLTSASYSLYINDSVETVVNNVYFAPLYLTSSTSFKVGSPIPVSGKSIPNQKVDIFLDDNFITASVANIDGLFIGTIKAVLTTGKHSLQLRQNINSQVLALGKSNEFTVLKKDGVLPIDNKKNTCGSRVDFSSDCKVNIIDFSILAYWHNRLNFPSKFDLNYDGKIDLKDFSIMAFYWTG